MLKRTILVSLVGFVAVVLLAGSANAGSSKKYVCHKEGNGQLKTLKVSSNAVPAHAGHGDFIGKCSDAPPLPSEVVMIRCIADEFDTAITVSSLSATEGAPEINANSTHGQGDSCAETMAVLRDDDFKLRTVLGDDAGGLATFYLFER